MFEEKTIVSDKESLFAASESEAHYVRVSPDSEEYLNAKTHEMDLDLNAMYRFMVDNFIDKTEPSLGAVDLLRLSPYVGNQLKEILPNPFADLQGDEVKNED